MTKSKAYIRSKFRRFQIGVVQGSATFLKSRATFVAQNQLSKKVVHFEINCLNAILTNTNKFAFLVFDKNVDAIKIFLFEI